MLRSIILNWNVKEVLLFDKIIIFSSDGVTIIFFNRSFLFSSFCRQISHEKKGKDRMVFNLQKGFFLSCIQYVKHIIQHRWVFQVLICFIIITNSIFIRWITIHLCSSDLNSPNKPHVFCDIFSCTYGFQKHKT